MYIIGHIPPGSDERQIGEIPNGHTTFSEVNNLRYIRLVRKYSSIIQGQFFGHLHSDSFRIVYDDGKSSFFLIYFFVQHTLTFVRLGKPVSWMMVAPSLTPRKMNVGSNNPALRLYKFDTDTGQVRLFINILFYYTRIYSHLSLVFTFFFFWVKSKAIK